MPGDPWQPEAPILEFDPAPSAVIEPGEVIEPIDVPLHVVLCFFQDVITTVVDELDLDRHPALGSFGGDGYRGVVSHRGDEHDLLAVLDLADVHLGAVPFLRGDRLLGAGGPDVAGRPCPFPW